VNYFLVLMFVNGMIYLLLALYFDQVLDDPYRARQPWLFFIKPSYWGFGTAEPVRLEDHDEGKGLLAGQHARDEDVEVEMEKARNGEAALRVDGLVRVFKGGRKFVCCGTKKPDLTAVNHLYLTADNGTLLCILGHNGAGKVRRAPLQDGR
jgi:hypothetical protein